jgi:hypothetical protein
MSELTFPYTMHCPKCKAKLKIAKPEMVGQRMTCPACKKKIDVVTPDEDGHVAYGLGEVRVQKHKSVEQEEEELEKIAEIEEIARKERRKAKTKWTIELIILLAMLGGVAWGFHRYVLTGYDERAAQKAKARENEPDLFGKTFSVD